MESSYLSTQEFEVTGKRSAADKISDILMLKAFQTHLAEKPIEKLVLFPDEFGCEEDKVRWKTNVRRPLVKAGLVGVVDGPKLIPDLLDIMKEVKICFEGDESFSKNLSVQVIQDSDGNKRFELISEETKENGKTVFHSWLGSLYSKLIDKDFKKHTAIDEALASNSIDLDSLAKYFPKPL